LPRAPEVSARGGYEHVFTLGSGAMVSFYASGNYQSSKYLTVDYLPAGRAKATFTADLDLTFAPADERYSITGFVHNVSNEAVYTGGSEHQQIANVFYATINPPRTYGVRAQVNF
jgi:iron complex outermembrane receptor protein